MSQKRMFEVKCTDCNKVTTVPFEPTKGKPIYCKECLSKHRQNRPTNAHQSAKFDFNNAWAIRRDQFPRKKAKTKSVFKR